MPKLSSKALFLFPVNTQFCKCAQRTNGRLDGRVFKLQACPSPLFRMETRGCLKKSMIAKPHNIGSGVINKGNACRRSPDLRQQEHSHKLSTFMLMHASPPLYIAGVPSWVGCEPWAANE
eukprot:scaffold107844_cov19-Tisochrysis_lutea.AAC.2